MPNCISDTTRAQAEIAVADSPTVCTENMWVSTLSEPYPHAAPNIRLNRRKAEFRNRLSLMSVRTRVNIEGVARLCRSRGSDSECVARATKSTPLCLAALPLRRVSVQARQSTPQRIRPSPSIPSHIAMRPRLKSLTAARSGTLVIPGCGDDGGPSALARPASGRRRGSAGVNVPVHRRHRPSSRGQPDTHEMIQRTSLVELHGPSPTRRSSDCPTTATCY